MIVEEKHYSIQEVFNLISNQYLSGDNDFNKNRVPDLEVDGFKIHTISLRYKTFYQKGCKCAICGKEGTHFRLCGDENTDRRHFNLYADDGTLITKDHIVPKSRGGQNLVSNMQTMCVNCNSRKGNDYPNGQGIEYIVVYNNNDKEICKFRDIDSAIKYGVLNLANMRGIYQSKKNAIDEKIKASITATLRIVQAIETGASVYGHHFVREIR